MLTSIKKWWGRLRERYFVSRQINPESFRDMAGELRDLAKAAGRFWPQEHTFQEKIRRIQAEMEQLDRLASRPEFRRLSPEKRLQLRRSLMQSREQLLESVQSAPAPTRLLQ